MLNKYHIFVLFVLVSILSSAQHSQKFLNATYNPDGVFDKPKFDTKEYQLLITHQNLQKKGFDNVYGYNIKGYRLLMGSAYLFNTEKDLEGILSKYQKEIQFPIDKVNKHADFELESKTLLSHNFPKGFFFRKPDKVNTNYKNWKNEYIRLGGIFIKAMGEESKLLNCKINMLIVVRMLIIKLAYQA
jgi:hypothetical protein